MSKKLDLTRIPNWEVGKWYFFEIALEWVSLITCAKKGEYNFPMMTSVNNKDYTRAFTNKGLHSLKDPFRTLLEPWEALILHPECKDTAPDGVDWAVPESIEPDGMPTPEQIKSATEAFKGIDTEKYIAFVRGFDEDSSSEAQPLPEDLFVQNRALMARNSELIAEIERLKSTIDLEKERYKSGYYNLERMNKELVNKIEQLERTVKSHKDAKEHNSKVISNLNRKVKTLTSKYDIACRRLGDLQVSREFDVLED